jgi:integrase/recombinase XerD
MGAQATDTAEISQTSRAYAEGGTSGPTWRYPMASRTRRTTTTTRPTIRSTVAQATVPWVSILADLIAHRDAQDASPKTLRLYDVWGPEFCTWAQAHGVTPASITSADFDRFVVSLKTRPNKRTGKPLASSSRRMIATVAGVIVHYAEDQGYITQAVKCARPKAKVPPQPTMRDAEVDKVLAACDDSDDRLRDRAAVLLLYESGMRRSEAVMLRWSDVGDYDSDLEQAPVHVAHPAKGGDERDTLVEVTGYQALIAYRRSMVNVQPDAWLFPSDQTSTGHMTPEGFGQVFKRLRLRTGIPCRCHSFRRGFCTRNRDVPMASLKKASGHKTDSVLINAYTLPNERERAQDFADAIRDRRAARGDR